MRTAIVIEFVVVISVGGKVVEELLLVGQEAMGFRDMDIKVNSLQEGWGCGGLGTACSGHHFIIRIND